MKKLTNENLFIKIGLFEQTPNRYWEE
jgi:hypothetical protein